MGGIRFDKVPHFSEIITCSRYRQSRVTPGLLRRQSQKKTLCFSLSPCVFLLLSLLVHPTLVLVAANEGVWLSLEALGLNYHIN